MKRIVPLVLLILLVSYSVAQNEHKIHAEFPELSRFPGVRDLTMSPSGTEAYITAQSPLEEVSVILRLTKSNGEWTHKIASFSGKYRDLEPFLSPDGLTLYFASNRPMVDCTQQVGDYDIWYTTRQSIDDDWSQAVNLGSQVNSEHNEFYPSVSNNKTIYFTSDRPGAVGKDDIFYSKWHDNKYSSPQALSDSINSEGYEFNAFIAPDESYLIYTAYRRPGGQGSGDLFISFRDANNEWGQAINLGAQLNSKFMDYCPYVNTTSQTLYFTSKRSSFKPVNDFKSTEQLIETLNQTENGMSKIYSVSLSAIPALKKIID